MYVKGEEQELVRINYDKTAMLFLILTRIAKGQERTNRNYELALDVAIQKKQP